MLIKKRKKKEKEEKETDFYVYLIRLTTTIHDQGQIEIPEICGENSNYDFITIIIILFLYCITLWKSNKEYCNGLNLTKIIERDCIPVYAV